jgi:uridine kinase
MYYEGVKKNKLRYFISNSYVIGIAGDSGSGKSRLSKIIEMTLGSRDVISLEGDDDHKWERGDENYNLITHLNPKANYIHSQSDAVQGLKNGLTVYRKNYNHTNGKFDKIFKVRPRRFIIINGLLTFYLDKSRRNIDLKIFLDYN